MTFGYIALPGENTTEIGMMFNRGGIISFSNIIGLIFLASAWASVLQHIGILEFLLNKLSYLKILKHKVRLTGYLISILTSVTTCAIIPAIFIPSAWLKERYASAGWQVEHLSQDMIEGSFAAASLVPWSNFNFLVLGTLGVGAFATVPYNIFAPLLIFSVIMKECFK